ncbi:MAG TPA: polysaccharide biosynthesis/export family protein [bacterium]
MLITVLLSAILLFHASSAAPDTIEKNSSPLMAALKDEPAIITGVPLGGEGKGEGELNPSAPYKIEAGDVLEIVILGEEELTRTLMVMHNGTISFPLIGEVGVVGLTTEEIARLLSEKLKTYFTHAVISVILKSPTLPHVSVFGEVLRPGSVEYQRGLRVTDYIALAGGPTNRANLKKVKAVRFVDQKAVVLTVNVDEILKKGRQDQNFELKSGDWVYINKRFTIEWGIVINTLSLAVSVVTLYITIQRL